MEFHRGRLLDHVQLRVKDLEASKRFYRAVLAALGQGENFYLLLTDPDGQALLGGPDRPVEKVEDVQRDGTGKATGMDGYSTLNLRQIIANQDKITSLEVPLSQDAADGSLAMFTKRLDLEDLLRARES